MRRVYGGRSGASRALRVKFWGNCKPHACLRLSGMGKKKWNIVLFMAPSARQTLSTYVLLLLLWDKLFRSSGQWLRGGGLVIKGAENIFRAYIIIGFWLDSNSCVRYLLPASCCRRLVPPRLSLCGLAGFLRNLWEIDDDNVFIKINIHMVLKAVSSTISFSSKLIFLSYA